MKLVYVTSRYPYGPGEAFLSPELAAHVAAGCGLRIFPAYPRGSVSHGDAAALLTRVVGRGPVRDAVALAERVAFRPAVARSVARIAAARQPARIRTKNVRVCSRLGSLVALLERAEPDHVHVHWGGTSSTLAMAAAEAVRVPWSVTLHRWDIYENNLLARKISSAAFTRVISDGAVGELRTFVPDADPVVLHMGVDLPAQPAPLEGAAERTCRFVCVASLVPVKNHQGLLRAFAASGTSATLELVGAGPLEQELRQLARSFGIDDRVVFTGLVDHDRLLERARAGDWDAVVLASGAGESEHEGIPVSLMEAMAAGLPAVATDSGATRELVTEQTGIVVPPGDTSALADALRLLGGDPDLRRRLGAAARRRVAESFDARAVAARLRELFGGAA